MKNNIVISFRINQKIQEYIAILKTHKIKHTLIMREAIKEALKRKCTQFKIDMKIEKTPF